MSFSSFCAFGFKAQLVLGFFFSYSKNQLFDFPCFQANQNVNEAFLALVKEMAKVHGKGGDKKKKKGLFSFGK